MVDPLNPLNLGKKQESEDKGAKSGIGYMIANILNEEKSDFKIEGAYDKEYESVIDLFKRFYSRGIDTHS